MKTKPIKTFVKIKNFGELEAIKNVSESGAIEILGGCIHLKGIKKYPFYFPICFPPTGNEIRMLEYCRSNNNFKDTDRKVKKNKKEVPLLLHGKKEIKNDNHVYSVQKFLEFLYFIEYMSENKPPPT